MRTALRSLGAAAVTLLSIGCTTSTPTEMTALWKDPSYTAGPMKSIVVFGGRMNATDRVTVEDELASALSKQGVLATPSYEMFPGGLPAKEDAQAALQKADIDGILIASMRGTQERETIYPGGYTGSFWSGYYGPGWGTGWDPGYVITDRLVKFDTSLWSPSGDGKIVWSAVTETENPKSSRDFASDLTESVVPALESTGLLPGAGGEE